jgi:Alpha-L-arabinofuranosidase B, catalytic
VPPDQRKPATAPSAAPDDEEEHVVPLIAEHLTAAEWSRLAERFGQEAPKSKLLFFLGLMLEEAGSCRDTAFEDAKVLGVAEMSPRRGNFQDMTLSGIAFGPVGCPGIVRREAAAGSVSFDYVGSVTAGDVAVGEDEEDAFPGEAIDQIRQHLVTDLPVYKPDVILLQLDVANDLDTQPGLTTGQKASDPQNLLNQTNQIVADGVPNAADYEDMADNYAGALLTLEQAGTIVDPGAVIVNPSGIIEDGSGIDDAGEAGSTGGGMCDIYAAYGTPCVGAYSLGQSLYSAYDGPLYQVTRASDGTTADIGLLAAGGDANASADRGRRRADHPIAARSVAGSSQKHDGPRGSARCCRTRLNDRVDLRCGVSGLMH